MTLQKTMDKWAQKLFAKAEKDNTPLAESTDAFKAVTAYYAARQKLAKKHGEEDDDPDGFRFDQIEVPNGGGSTKVRTTRSS